MSAVVVPHAERSREVRRVLRLVLWMNLAVLGVKVGVWSLSHALSVLAEITHSSLDAANNVFALVMARVASQEPDDRHPYGHQKFELIGALALVAVLSVTVFELLQRAVARFLEGGSVQAPVVDPWAVGLMALSVVAGVAITRYESRVGRRLGSDLLLADAAHTRADVLATIAVLVGLVLIRMGWPLADPAVTLLVAVAIGYTGWQIVRETVPMLVDERAVHPMRIQTLASGVEGVRSTYHIRSRGRVGECFAELTIAVDPGLDVASSHAIADEVEARVADALGAREVVVHVEPWE